MKSLKLLLLILALGCLSEAQTVVSQFDGIGGNGVLLTQPNPNIATSGTQVLETTTETVTYYTTAGALISTTDWCSWMAAASPAVTCTNIRAPRIAYDNFISRWLVMAANINGDRIYVSSGSDLSTATWKDVAFGGALGAQGDLTPRIGFDKNGVYVTEFDQSTSPLTYTWYAIPGADLAWAGAGAPSLSNLQTFTLQGFEASCAMDLNASKAATDPEFCGYVSGPRQTSSGVFNWLFAYITWPSGAVGGACTNGTGTAPCATASSQQSIASTFHATTTTANPAQPSPGNPIKGTESIQEFGAYQQGVHVVLTRASGPCPSSCGTAGVDTQDIVLWAEFDVTNKNAITKINDGKLSSTIGYLFPYAAYDSSGNLVITASGSNASTYPTLYSWWRKPADTANSLTGPTVVTSGINYAASGVSNPVPWGKFTNGVQDPSNGSFVWFVGQYGKSNSSGAWQTRIVKFQPVPPPSAPVPTGNFSSVQIWGAVQ
jgi:hypothetical protein